MEEQGSTSEKTSVKVTPRSAKVQVGSWLMGASVDGQFFLTQLVYIQNDQRVMGIILRYVCWGTPPPPPRSPAADPQGFGQRRGVEDPPPLYNP